MKKGEKKPWTFEERATYVKAYKKARTPADRKRLFSQADKKAKAAVHNLQRSKASGKGVHLNRRKQENLK
jgi:hypothetical protein